MRQKKEADLDLIELKVQALERFIEEKERRKREAQLRYLFWESTLRCNLNCRHCGSDCVREDGSQHKEITPERMMKELRAIAEVYPAEAITLAIIGGEPLLRETDVLKVGRFAADLGYHWGIVTNGLLLTPEVIRRLKAAGLQTISVSLDGLAEEHERLRNAPGSYAIVTNAIRDLLADRFFLMFDVICCVSSINIGRLEPFLDELISMGVPAVRFTPVFSRGRSGRNKDLLLTNAQYRQLLEFIARKRSSGLPIRIDLSEEGYWGPEWECVVRDDFHYCGSGTLIGSVLHDGKVTGCPSVSRSFIEGNIKETPFVQIWQEGFGRYREERKETFASQCGECEHWVLCEGGGFHLLDLNLDQSACCLERLK